MEENREMATAAKLAVCCYCGGRTLLTLSGAADKRELTCPSCAAPLRKLKPIKRAPDAAPAARRAKPQPSAPRRPEPSRPAAPRPETRRAPPRRKKKERRRPSGVVRLIREIIDEIEDIFD